MTEAGIAYYPRWQCTWSAEEIAKLYRGSNLGQTAEEIAAELGRTAKSIREKCSALNLAVRPRPESHWTDQRLKHCKLLYDAGHSAKETGLELGCTRNAVIGIWHRHPDLFLPRPHIVNGKSVVKKMRARGPRRQPRREAAPVFESTPIIKSTIEPPPDDFSLWPVTIVESAEQHCRFPVWSRPYLMCGADKIKGFSYCGWHCRIAYAPDKRARRQGGFRLRTWAA